jgi:hypothetical protein
VPKSGPPNPFSERYWKNDVIAIAIGQSKELNVNYLALIEADYA